MCLRDQLTYLVIEFEWRTTHKVMWTLFNSSINYFQAHEDDDDDIFHHDYESLPMHFSPPFFVLGLVTCSDIGCLVSMSTSYKSPILMPPFGSHIFTQL